MEWVSDIIGWLTENALVLSALGGLAAFVGLVAGAIKLIFTRKAKPSPEDAPKSPEPPASLVPPIHITLNNASADPSGKPAPAPSASPAGVPTTPLPANASIVSLTTMPLPRNKDLVGRDAKIAELEAALTSGTVVAVTSVQGHGGVGKTALACHVAHKLQAAGHFSDGISFIDLRGYSEGTTPVTPVDALQALIRDVTGDRETPLPTEVEALSAHWATAVARQDRLILLDNARDTDQIAPLIPNVQGPRVLITARSTIAGADTPIDLEALTDRDGARLARDLVNKHRAGRLTAEAATRLTGLCQGLPKAIELAAGYLVTHPSMEVTAYLDRLEQSPGNADDPVRAAIALTLGALNDETRARFAALAVFAGPAERDAIAAVWDTDAPGDTLDTLMSQFLVDTGERGSAHRFTLHDRVRAVAASLLREDADHDHATRLHHAGWFSDLLTRANDQYFEHGDAAITALALFDRNRPDILAARDWLAPRVAEDELAAQAGLAFAYSGIILLRLTPREALAWFQIGQRAAERLGNKTALAAALCNLGLVAQRRGDLAAAEDYFNRGLEIDEELGRKEGMAANLGNLGLVAYDRGDLAAAEDYFNRGLEIDEELGGKEGMAANLGNLGGVACDRGDLDAAEKYYNRALAINDELGRKGGMATNLGNLGGVACDRGDLDGAEDFYNRALVIDEELGQREGIARHTINLGLVAEARGDTAKAVQLWRQALALYTDLGMKPMIERVSGWIARYDDPDPPV